MGSTGGATEFDRGATMSSTGGAIEIDLGATETNIFMYIYAYRI